MNKFNKKLISGLANLIMLFLPVVFLSIIYYITQRNSSDTQNKELFATYAYEPYIEQEEYRFTKKETYNVKEHPLEQPITTNRNTPYSPTILNTTTLPGKKRAASPIINKTNSDTGKYNNPQKPQKKIQPSATTSYSKTPVSKTPVNAKPPATPKTLLRSSNRKSATKQHSPYNSACIIEENGTLFFHLPTHITAPLTSVSCTIFIHQDYANDKFVATLQEALQRFQHTTIEYFNYTDTVLNKVTTKDIVITKPDILSGNYLQTPLFNYHVFILDLHSTPLQIESHPYIHACNQTDSVILGVLEILDANPIGGVSLSNNTNSIETFPIYENIEDYILLNQELLLHPPTIITVSINSFSEHLTPITFELKQT